MSRIVLLQFLSVILSINLYATRVFSDKEPLLLTPLLDSGDIHGAQQASAIDTEKFSEIPPSHAGFLTVDRALGNHLFFWYFPSPKEPKAPLLVWLNGGPAVSSMLGLLWEHGPLSVQNNGLKGVTFESNAYSWVGTFSVVYVDNPVGTGYSYSDSGTGGYKLTQDEYTSDLYNFVLQFTTLFPEYRSRGIYIGGQSYAGKYVPALAYRLHMSQAEGDKSDQNLNLLGILLGGPYFDPQTESIAFFDYLYALGVISHADKVRHKIRVVDMYETFLEGGNANATFSELFTDLVLLSELPLPSLDNYVTGKDADYHAVQTVMSSPEIRQVVHVGSRDYHVSNDELSELYGPDVLVSTKSKLAALMDNYKVLIYNGDYDVVVSSVMIDSALHTTPWSGQKAYNESHRSLWRRDNRLEGFYSQTGQMCRVVVHGAGHQTPHDKPEACHQMVSDFLKYGCILPENWHRVA